MNIETRNNEDGIAGSVKVGKYDLTTYETSDNRVWISVNNSCPERAGEVIEVSVLALEKALDVFFKENI